MKLTKLFISGLAIIILQGCQVYKRTVRDYQRQDFRVYPDIENTGVRIIIQVPSKTIKPNKF